MRVLVTGGAGYIGSHTVLQLLERGDEVTVLDNLSNSSEVSLKRVAHLAGCAPMFVKGDIRDAVLLAEVFAQSRFDAVVHFAGLKAVGESVAQPLRYYQNNVTGSMVLLEAMQAAKVYSLVFSSSATVYGDPQQLPLREDSLCGQTTNPYGRSKWMVEQLLADLCLSDPNWRVARLRYFNPVGAHPSGLIGEDPAGIPNNLMPFISQVASGRRAALSVYGNDYPTVDGTGVRDYIHVMDLAAGHLAALNLLASDAGVGLQTVNLGTGQGYSVLEVLAAFERASGLQIPYQVVGRRPGDVASCYADPSRALELLGWKARRGLDEMCVDAWRWQSSNPNGYGKH